MLKHYKVEPKDNFPISHTIVILVSMNYLARFYALFVTEIVREPDKRPSLTYARPTLTTPNLDATTDVSAVVSTTLFFTPRPFIPFSTSRLSARTSNAMSNKSFYFTEKYLYKQKKKDNLIFGPFFSNSARLCRHFGGLPGRRPLISRGCSHLRRKAKLDALSPISVTSPVTATTYDVQLCSQQTWT